jgi:hypothetical protein
MVQLPAYTLETSLAAASAIKERLQLAVSALTTMGEVWPMAKMVKVQVSQYAREVLTIPRTPASEAVTGFSIQQSELAAFNEDSWVDLLGRFEPIGTPQVGYDNMQTFNMEAGISWELGCEMFADFLRWLVRLQYYNLHPEDANAM